MKPLRSLQDTFVVPLTQNQVALVDERDWYRLKEHSWYAAWVPRLRSYYAARNFLREDGTRTTQYMHREVLGLQPGDPEHVDHENHNTLDNRRENLRAVSHRENMENLRRRSKCGPGIRRKGNRFRVDASIHRRRYHLGYFPTEESARDWRAGFLEGVECDTPEKVREAVERFLRDC